MNIWDTDMRFTHNREEVREVIQNYKSDRDLYYLAGLVMASRYSNYHDAISSLFMTVDGNSLKRLCKVLGGQEIKIPTYDELIDSFKIIRFMNEYNKGKTIQESMSLSGFDSSDFRKVVELYNGLLKEIGKK